MSEELSYSLAEFTPEDIPGVIGLFEVVYGRAYPFPGVYESDYWREQTGTDDLFSYVARRGEVPVGITSYYRTAPFPGLYESGQLIVHPEHRRGNLGFRLLRFSLDAFRAEPVCHGIFTEVGCHWTVSQRLTTALGYRETALAVDLLGGETYSQEHNVSGRISAVMANMAVRPRPHTVHLPTDLHDFARFVYAGAELERTLAAGEASPSGQGHVESSYMAEPRVSRADIRQWGVSSLEEVLAVQARDRAEGALVFQVRVPLEDPCAPAGIQRLQEHGYRVCGLLPRWFDGDGLLLQCNLEPVNLEGNKIHSQWAQALAARVAEFWV